MATVAPAAAAAVDRDRTQSSTCLWNVQGPKLLQSPAEHFDYGRTRQGRYHGEPCRSVLRASVINHNNNSATLLVFGTTDPPRTGHSARDVASSSSSSNRPSVCVKMPSIIITNTEHWLKQTCPAAQQQRRQIFGSADPPLDILKSDPPRVLLVRVRVLKNKDSRGTRVQRD